MIDHLIKIAKPSHMPWVLNKTFYIETDVRRMDEFHLKFHLEQVIKKYQEAYQPDQPPIQPPVEEVMPLIEEWGKVYRVKTHFGQGGEAGRRKRELLKLLQPIIEQWGEYMIQLVEAKKIYGFYTGFPYLSMDSLRRPTSVSQYYVSRDWNKGITTMECSKKPAMLLYFHWQASEDKQHWFTIATTQTPKLTTKKLDRDKRYYFRMYMSNPKGESDMHQHWNHQPF